MESSPYQAIVDDIVAAIDAGELRPGDQLPSTMDLAEQYGVARPTVGKAFARLRALGLVEGPMSGRMALRVRSWRRVRRVYPHRLDPAVTWGQGRAIQDADTKGRDRVVSVDVDVEPAVGRVAAAFGWRVGGMCVRRSRLIYVDDRPVQIAVSWIPTDIAAGTVLERRDTGPGGMWAVLAELGHEPAMYPSETLNVRLATPGERARLDLQPTDRVVDILRVTSDVAGRVVDVTEMTFVADAYTFEFRPGG